MWRSTDPEMDEFYQHLGVCPIFLLVNDEERVCQCTDCRHHVFYWDGKKKPWAHNETEHTRLMRNCVTFGIENVGGLALEDISAIYGIARERVRQIIEKLFFGPRGLGKYIINRPVLVSRLNVTAGGLANFHREFNALADHTKAKNDYSQKYYIASLKGREEECHIK